MAGLITRLTDAVTNILILAPIVLITMTFHEFAHAFVSYKLGDFTAKSEGRLSLNPLRHIDPVGAIFLIIFRFGWAKPVPVRMLYFKNPKRDMMLTSIAGPIMNLLLAIVIIPFYALSAKYLTGTPVSFMNTFFSYFISMNIGFAAFNMIPIPPLDGSRVLLYFLPDSAFAKVMVYERYSFLILMLLVLTGILSPIISFVVNIIAMPMKLLINVIYHLLP